jgi:diguanylate cyclase (GGDEF)-like protein
MDADLAEYLRFRRKLVVGYVVVCTLLAALLGWKIIAGYAADHEAARTLTRNNAAAMAAHVEELVDAVDQPLRTSAASIAAMRDTRMTASAIQPLLAASSLASDSRFWLLFIDAAGTGVVASNGLAVGGVSFADRPYFQQAATDVEDNLHIGGPVFGRVSRRRVFFVSRRVTSRAGKLLGVVAAPIDAERVANVFDKARLGPAMSITLMTRDNVIVARAPLFSTSFGADLSHLVNAPPPPFQSGQFEANSPFSGEERLFAYAPVGKLPLWIIVGITKDAWIARARADLIAGLIGLAAAFLAAFLSGNFALRQYRRLAAVETAQRRLITDLNLAKLELARGERRLRIIANNVPAQIYYLNADERFTYHNQGEAGAPLGALMAKTFLETHGCAVYTLLQDDIRQALAGNKVNVERSYLVDGTLRHFKHEYTPDVAEDGRVWGFYAMVSDVTDFKTIQERLASVARIDGLTGLPNRAELLDRLEQALARCRRTGQSLACLYMDIDRFKHVNDTYGHAGGDAALIEFGARLRGSVRATDLVARLAGDEFVIALESLDHPAEAEQVAAKIIASMLRPFDIEGALLTITTSIGMVIADPQTDDSRTLLRAADTALYRAKRAGRNRLEIAQEH